MGRLADRTAVRIAFFTLIATALVWTMLPSVGWLNEFRDAQVLTLHERAAADSVAGSASPSAKAVVAARRRAAT